jgi:hypothetical protein
MFFTTSFLKEVLDGLSHHCDTEMCSVANTAHTAQFLDMLRLE